MINRTKLTQPEDVFTPRSAIVNSEMYVDRDDLEKALGDSLRESKHLILHGESGSGKSWLYKKVFSKLDVEYLVVNLANASRFQSIASAMNNLIKQDSANTMTGYTETKSAEANIQVAKGSLATSKTFEINRKDDFRACLEFLRDRAGETKTAVLVFDNLESVFEEESLMKELATLITLLDDEQYAEFRIKFLIVGTPSQVLEYFYRTPNAQTVANRLKELPEVRRFSKDQTTELVQRGFRKLLKYECEDTVLLQVSEHIMYVTDGIPQRLHEYCLVLARSGTGDRRLDLDDLSSADRRWLHGYSKAAYSAVESAMNDRATALQRRNQVLYTIGAYEGPELRAGDIETELRKHFPTSTSDDVQLNIPQIFADLARRKPPIIRRSPKGDSYVFVDPVYRMALRTMLTLDQERVTKHTPS